MKQKVIFVVINMNIGGVERALLTEFKKSNEGIPKYCFACTD